MQQLYMVAQAVAMMAQGNTREKNSSPPLGSSYLGELNPPNPDELRRKAIGLEQRASDDRSPRGPSPQKGIPTGELGYAARDRGKGFERKVQQVSDNLEAKGYTSFEIIRAASVSPRGIPQDNAANALKATTVPPLRNRSRTDPDGRSLWISSSPSQASYYAKGWPRQLPKIPTKYIVKEVGEGMGTGVFATRDIKKFEPVLVERPFLVYPKRSTGLVSHQVAAQPSENQVRQLVQRKTEEIYLGFVEESMEETARRDFMSLTNSHKDDGGGPITGIVRTNGFDISFGQELPGTDQDFGGGYGAVGKIGSRFNHCCVPDVVPAFDPVTFTIKFVATRDIKAGSQIFTSYTRPNGTKAECEKALDHYGFECRCRYCVNATPQSDMLRKSSKTRIENWMNKATRVWIKDNQLKESVLAPLLETKRMMEEEGLDLIEMQYPYLWIIMGQVYGKLGNSQKSRQCTDSDAFTNYCQGWSRAWGWATGDK